MWLCYGVMSLCLVFVLCQPVHSYIEPFLHGLDIFLDTLLWRVLLIVIGSKVIKSKILAYHAICISFSNKTGITIERAQSKTRSSK